MMNEKKDTNTQQHNAVRYVVSLCIRSHRGVLAERSTVQHIHFHSLARPSSRNSTRVCPFLGNLADRSERIKRNGTEFRGIGIPISISDRNRRPLHLLALSIASSVHSSAVTHSSREIPYNVGKFPTKKHVTRGVYALARDRPPDRSHSFPGTTASP